MWLVNTFDKLTFYLYFSSADKMSESQGITSAPPSAAGSKHDLEGSQGDPRDQLIDGDGLEKGDYADIFHMMHVKCEDIEH